MSKLARDARLKAERTGLLPHEILLDIARGNPQKESWTDQETGEIIVKHLPPAPMEMRVDAAKAAAPYFAPKISTVEVIQGVGDEDLDSIIARAAAEAGVSIGFDGESEEDEAEGGASTRPRTRVRIIGD
jgi:hypothetical protein